MTDTSNQDRFKELIANWEKHGQIFPLRSVKDCLSAGAMLLLIKEATPHGKFADKANQLGFHVRQARRFMACARNFYNRSDAFLNAVDSASKLIELSRLDKSEIDALERGEDVHGITLENLKFMTVLELRQALHDARTQLQAHCLAKLADRSAKPEQRNTTTLSVDEEQMLRNYRKCAKEAQAVILATAVLLVR